jgi:cytochrome c
MVNWTEMNLIVRMKPILFLRGSATALIAAAAVSSAQAASAAPPPPDGATVFRQRCQSCHTVADGKASRVGPDLAGIVGRKAASRAFNYSAALKRSGLIWNRNNLDRYLAAPSRLVPGTRMTVSLSDTKQRTALIAYLSKAK